MKDEGVWANIVFENTKAFYVPCDLMYMLEMLQSLQLQQLTFLELYKISIPHLQCQHLFGALKISETLLSKTPIGNKMGMLYRKLYHF
jgi:hypothetical protein